MKVNAKGICCLIVICVVFIVAGVAFAQPGPGGGFGGQKPSKPSVSDQVAQIKQALNLTDAQAGKVKTILENKMSQMESLMRSGDPQSSRSQMESIKKEMEREVAGVLTADQLAQWKKGMSQRLQGSGSNQPSQGSSGVGGGAGKFESGQRSRSGSGVY